MTRRMRRARGLRELRQVRTSGPVKTDVYSPGRLRRRAKNLLNLENKTPYAWLRLSVRDPVKLRAQAISRPPGPLIQALLNYENKSPGEGEGGGIYAVETQATARKYNCMGDISLVSKGSHDAACSQAWSMRLSLLRDMDGLDMGDHTR